MYEREFATGIFKDGCRYSGGYCCGKSDAGMGCGWIVASGEGLTEGLRSPEESGD